MGCLKLYQDRDREGLEKSSVFFRETLGKKGGQEKNRVNYYPFGFVMNSYTSNGEKCRFGYQGDFSEDDTEETGFNHFEARQYDSRIGKWTTIDPAREFASPYVAMGNNPLSLVDPTGGITSPIYTKEGKFLGVDSQGFAGEIVIMGESTFNELTNNGTEILDHSFVELLVTGGVSANYIGSISMSSMALSNVYTDVLNKFSDINTSSLYNNAVSIRDFNEVSPDNFNNPSSPGRYNATPSLNRINVNRGYSNELTSVEIIQSYLGIHEWRAHIVDGVGKSNHFEAYQQQKNHPTFKLLPGYLQKEILNRSTSERYGYPGN